MVPVVPQFGTASMGRLLSLGDLILRSDLWPCDMLRTCCQRSSSIFCIWDMVIRRHGNHQNGYINIWIPMKIDDHPPIWVYGAVGSVHLKLWWLNIMKVKRRPGPTIGAPQEWVTIRTCIMHIIVVSQDLTQSEVGIKTEQEGWGIARRDQIFKCQSRQPPFLGFNHP